MNGIRYGEFGGGLGWASRWSRGQKGREWLRGISFGGMRI